MEYSGIITAIVEGDQALPFTIIYDANNTKVYRVDLPDKLIVKFSAIDENAARFQSRLLQAIDSGDDLTAEILHWESRESKGELRIAQVMRFLEGEPLKEFPDFSESKAIIQSTFQLHEKLRAATNLFNPEEVMLIADILPGLVAMAKDSRMKKAAARLLENHRYQEICKLQPDCLIDGDLWPENFLIDRSNHMTKARIVDLDPVLLGPPILQPAILFSSCFLLSYFMNSGMKNISFDLDSLISCWPESLDRQDILIMMQVFPIALSLQKELQFKQKPDRDLKSHQDSQHIHSRCLGYIEEQLN